MFLQHLYKTHNRTGTAKHILDLGVGQVMISKATEIGGKYIGSEGTNFKNSK